MEILNVLVAAVGCFALGAIWYNVLSKPWMAAAGIKVDANGRPEGGGSPMPFVISFVMMVIIAGMMRHVMAMSPAIDTLMDGVMTGFGVGAFFITPWIFINNAYQMKPLTLSLIDGGYATCGCTIAGAILMAF